MQNLALQNSMGGPTSVGMAHQPSHQGTNPSNAGTPAGGSANASPATGKRRRPSGAQGKGDIEEVMEVNGVGGSGAQLGAKVKASPVVRGTKRQKGNG